MNKSQLKIRLRELLQKSRGHAQIGSCYVDTGQGIEACRQWINQNLITDSHDGYDQEANDNLISNLTRAVEENWSPTIGSLALFWGISHDSPLLLAVPLPMRVNHRISVYRQPDIRPIIPLLNDESNITILAYRGTQMQVFDVNLGEMKPVAWALAPHLAGPAYTSHNEARSMEGDRRLKLVCLSLINSKHKPLMLAANSEDLDQLRNWLPRAIAWHLDAHLTLPHSLGETGLSNYIEQQFRLHQGLAADGLVNRLLNSVRTRGPAVTGSIASLRALQQKRVDRLVVTDEALNEPGGRCAHCGALQLDIGQSDTCAACGHDMSIGFHHVIESCWMAYEQDIPVYQVGSDELQYLGGMGCILEHDDRSQVIMPKPAAELRGLDLVA